MLSLLLFSIAIVSVSFLPVLPTLQWLVISFIVFGSFSYWFKKPYLIAIPLGLIYATWVGNVMLANQIPDPLDRADVLVTGQVVGLPKTSGAITRFEFIVATAAPYKTDETATQSLIGQRLSVSYHQRYNFKHPLAIMSFQPGQLLQLRLKLRKPRGFVNPAGFDYHLYLLRQGFSATAYVKSDAMNQVLPDTLESSLILKRDLIRYRLRSFVEEYAGTYPQTAGALLALMSGDKQLIATHEWELFQATGTIHLMVISGLHIGLLAWIGFGLGRLIVKCLVLLTPIGHSVSLLLIPSALSISFAGIYATIAGLGLPTQRALVMVFIFHLFYCLQMQNRPWLGFLIAISVVLMIDPLAAHTPGFWLSFGAVGILLFSFQGYQCMQNSTIVTRTLWQWLRSQWVLCIGLGVPSIVLLGGLSGSSILSNFIAVPIVSFFVVPIALLSAITLFILEPVAIWLLQVAQTIMAFVFWCLNYINDVLPSFIHHHNTLQPLIIILAIVGVSYHLAPSLSYRYFALLCISPILFAYPTAIFLRVSFLDVGQGSAIVIETKNHQMVYDTGKKYSEQFDSGADIIAPYLSSLAYQTVDTVMVSHGDNDHAGGLTGLLAKVTTSQLLVGEVDKNAGEQCMTGQQWQWDGVQFDVLWPSEEYIAAMNSKPVYYKSNNISCVLLMTAGENRVLLAGDIDYSIERRLLNRLKQEHGIDVVLAPHHGSKTSSSAMWIEATQPQYAVFTAGYRNSYGHPHPTVVERYRKAGAQILNTADDGAIRLSLDGYQHNWRLERWRSDYRHYWH